MFSCFHYHLRIHDNDFFDKMRSPTQIKLAVHPAKKSFHEPIGPRLEKAITLVGKINHWIGAFLPNMGIIQFPTFNLRIAFTPSNYTLNFNETSIIPSTLSFDDNGPTRA